MGLKNDAQKPQRDSNYMERKSKRNIIKIKYDKYQ